jgi:hypothetical protein
MRSRQPNLSSVASFFSGFSAPATTYSNILGVENKKEKNGS